MEPSIGYGMPQKGFRFLGSTWKSSHSKAHMMPCKQNVAKHIQVQRISSGLTCHNYILSLLCWLWHLQHIFGLFWKAYWFRWTAVLFTFAWSVPIDCFIKFIQRRGEGCRGLMRTLINTSLTRFVHTSLKILKVDGRLCYLVRLRSRIRAFARHQVLSGAFAAWCFRPANVFP